MDVLIFTGGQAPLTDDVRPFFINRNFDYIIAADSGLDAYEAYRKAGLVCRNPDFLTGDFDSVSDRTLIELYPDAEKKIYSHDKDYTDSELALIKAREVAGTDGTVTLCGGNGGRPDHFMALYDSFSRDYHADIWLCGLQAVWFCGEGTSMEISGVGHDDRISVSRISSEYRDTTLECDGLEWNALFPAGMPSLSNRISKEYEMSGKPVKLFAKKGSFLVYVDFYAGVSVKPKGQD